MYAQSVSRMSDEKLQSEWESFEKFEAHSPACDDHYYRMQLAKELRLRRLNREYHETRKVR